MFLALHCTFHFSCTPLPTWIRWNGPLHIPRVLGNSQCQPPKLGNSTLHGKLSQIIGGTAGYVNLDDQRHSHHYNNEGVRGYQGYYRKHTATLPLQYDLAVKSTDISWFSCFL